MEAFLDIPSPSLPTNSARSKWGRNGNSIGSDLVYILNANFVASGRLGRAQMLDGSGPLVAQMSEQDVAELASGAAAQRLQDGLLFAHRFPPALPLPADIG